MGLMVKGHSSFHKTWIGTGLCIKTSGFRQLRL